MDQSLLESMRVIALPTKTNFRGVNLREVALFHGEYGWGEFSPFLEYDFQECVPWLMSAIEAASQPRPKLLRTSIRVNGTIPALDDKSEIEKIIESFPGVETFKVKVGDNLQADLVRLARVKSLRPKARLRIDVNGGWTVSQAVTHKSYL